MRRARSIAISALIVSAAIAAASTPESIDAAYARYKERLDRLYTALSARFRTDAPDLFARIKTVEPKALVAGYQVLPKLLPEPAPAAEPPRSAVSEFSWPKTAASIEREAAKIGPALTAAERAGTLPATDKRAAYETLATEFAALQRSQRLIDAWIQYNKLWQPSIAANRAIYDHQTELEHAVVERQEIRDELARAGADPVKGEALRDRERALSEKIHAATDEIVPLPFITLEHPSAHRWTIRVPVVSDIADDAFVRAFRATVERTWQVKDGGDEYRVLLSLKRISPQRLYRGSGSAPPRPGDAVDLTKHLARFPAGAAVLTTGAVTTHVTSVRCIVIGPNDVAPHDLAHEFGHILGFKDVYFRGYVDLGADGFEIHEVVAEPGDIMGGLGPVRREQLERLVEAIGKARSR